MTGKEILEKHFLDFAKLTGADREEALSALKELMSTSVVALPLLSAMREVAEMAFEAGFHHFQSGFYHGWRVGMSPNTIQTTPSKEEFINSLFPKEK